tara:strand:- start:351 stop:551 length:201 start_codon:yes stop_codon:yes gene_type:complete
VRTAHDVLCFDIGASFPFHAVQFNPSLQKAREQNNPLRQKEKAGTLEIKGTGFLNMHRLTILSVYP